MNKDWGRLAQAIAAARESRGMTQKELAEALDLSRSGVQKLERGTPYARVQPTHLAVARFFGWTPDSIDRILAGGDPEAVRDGPAREGSPETELDASLGDLPLRVLHAIGAGRLVDSAVINLDPNDPDATAVLVLKRGRRPDASPEQLREDMRKWSELERAAREIYGDDQSA